jgi:hypothetical protein
MITWNELPVEIQNRMLDEQERQGNKRDPKPFRIEVCEDKLNGGMSWCETNEGDNFWIIVLTKDFNHFYTEYPKEKLVNFCVKVNPITLPFLVNIRSTRNIDQERINKFPYAIFSRLVKASGSPVSVGKELSTQEFLRFIIDGEIEYKANKREVLEQLEVLPVEETIRWDISRGIPARDTINSISFTKEHKLEAIKEQVRELEKEIEEEKKPRLPVINGKKGEITLHKDIGYGCAKLLKGWFLESDNRHIKSLVLSSGVEINEEQMNQIREFVKGNEELNQ